MMRPSPSHLLGETARLAFVTGAAETREAAIDLAEHFRELDATDRAFDQAAERGQKEMREFGLSPDDIALFNRLAGAVVFTGPTLRQPNAAPAMQRFTRIGRYQ